MFSILWAAQGPRLVLCLEKIMNQACFFSLYPCLRVTLSEVGEIVNFMLVNLRELRDTQILGKHYFWVCLWRCFQKRLSFKSVDALPHQCQWSSFIQPTENLKWTKWQGNWGWRNWIDIFRKKTSKWSTSIWIGALHSSSEKSTSKP